MPYGVFRYKQIIDECFVISKTIHTSYLDLMNISVIEKNRILDIIEEENKRQQEQLDEIKKKKRR